MEPDLEETKHHFVNYLPQVWSFGSLRFNGGCSPLAREEEAAFANLED